MTDDRWIVVPHWDRFQHYGLARRPLWIKNYIALLHKDEYLDLSLGERGLLHGIWLAYADCDGRLRVSDVPRLLKSANSTRTKHMTSLNHAGLIEFSASKPLYLDLQQGIARARAREGPPPCPECGVGAGLHVADCSQATRSPTAASPTTRRPR